MLPGSGEPLLISYDYHMTCTVCMQASGFGVYVPYCENKPLSESFLWKYAHAEGTFFSVSVDRQYRMHSSPRVEYYCLIAGGSEEV